LRRGKQRGEVGNGIAVAGVGVGLDPQYSAPSPGLLT
jgi:hypothetical protein